MFFTAAVYASGGSIEAKSAALMDVKSAIALASDGDTVVIPVGEASWTAPLFIAKGITLQGATTVEGAAGSPAVTDGTVVVDNIPRQDHSRRLPKQQQGLSPNHAAPLAGAKPLPIPSGVNSKPIPGLLLVELKPNQSFRLTGFTFRAGAVSKVANRGGIRLTGTSQAMRIDHCHFDGLLQNPTIYTSGQICGVVDHCVWDSARHVESFQVYHDRWGGYAHGDGSWADDNHFGSDRFLFIETNTFRQPGEWSGGSIDCYGGGRYVARYNYFNNATPNTHGTETSGRFRGTRAVEIYNNTINWTASHQASGQLRSGTLLQHNNTWTGNAGDLKGHSMVLSCYRELFSFPFWGGANGNNRLDLNDHHGLYASGKHLGAVTSSGTLVAPGAGWKPNQWVGYMLTNTTQTTSRGMRHCSRILSNTGDTITYDTGTPDGQLKTFNPGDGFVIYNVLVALDQPGRGKGDLLTDMDPIVTGSWPHEALEPVYAWGNVYEGEHQKTRQLNVASNYPTILENRDFYNQKTPFDGTTGVGVGKLADRPKTCTPGVAYWATDQGEWNSTQEGPDGQLYVCTAENTWTFHYKPYTFPHPLVSGAPESGTAEERQQAPDHKVPRARTERRDQNWENRG